MSLDEEEGLMEGGEATKEEGSKDERDSVEEEKVHAPRKKSRAGTSRSSKDPRQGRCLRSQP